jgi:hypothetical protein
MLSEKEEFKNVDNPHRIPTTGVPNQRTVNLLLTSGESCPKNHLLPWLLDLVQVAFRGPPTSFTRMFNFPVETDNFQG